MHEDIEKTHQGLISRFVASSRIRVMIPVISAITLMLDIQGTFAYSLCVESLSQIAGPVGSLSMVIRKHIRIIVVVFLLHHFGFDLSSLNPLAKATVEGQAITSLAWAVEDEAGKPETAPTPTAEQQPSAQPPDSSGQPSPEPKDAGTETPKEPEADRGFVDALHHIISQRLLSSATWLDSFFGDERYLIEQNRSYLRFRYEVFKEEKSNMLFRPAVDLRIVLPQLEKKTHLVFSAEPAQTPPDTGTAATLPGERIATSEERKVTTALHYFVRSTRKESFIVRTGVQLSHYEPVLFVAPRYRSLIPLNSWDFRFTQEVRYSTKTAWQTDTILDLERPLARGFFFCSTIDGAWFSNTKGYFYSLILSLRQALDATHALDYEWIHSFQTRPVYELAEIAFRIRYRQSFLRDWFYFEVAPQIRLPRTEKFDILPGIWFRIEAYFGRILP
jgi:hypothetical protein